MELSIIIVSWNIRDKLKDNLKALFSSQTKEKFEVFVVDNNSEDFSADMVEREFPEVNLIRNNANYGFAKANNQVIRQIESKYILLLNPDMLLKADTIENLLNWAQANPQAAVTGARLVNEAGETIKHVRRFPRLSDQLAIVLKLPHIFNGILKNYIRDNFDYKDAACVDSVRGGFFLINQEKIKNLKLFVDSTLPQMDERYFLWFEEVDYCRQIRKAGGEVWYTPAAECIDLVGQSFNQLRRRQSQKYVRDSMLKYFKKWHPYHEYLILKFAWPIGRLIAIIGEKIGIKSRAKT